MEIVGFVPGVRLGAKACRVNIGAGAGQHHAVDRIQQCADIRKVGGPGKHQRQRARHFGHRAKISLSDQLRRESVFDAIGVPDHTNHRPPHRLLSNLTSQISDGSCLAADAGSTYCLPQARARIGRMQKQR